MKLTIPAGELAAALITSAIALNEKAKIPVLGAVHLTARAGDEVACIVNSLDFAVTSKFVCQTAEPGEVVTPAARLAGLIDGFAPDAPVTLVTDETALTVSCGRSRYRLPTWPLGDFPAPLSLSEITGEITLEIGVALRLLSLPLMAASTEATRYYLNGLCLHDVDGGVTCVATDGLRLMRLTVPVEGSSLSVDRHLIVPLNAAKRFIKLLRKIDGGTIILRCSRTLLQITAPTFSAISKLIDADFVAYERVIPQPTGKTVTVDRAELMSALQRATAAADPKLEASAIVGLQWSKGMLRLSLLRQQGAVDDEIAVDTKGKAQGQCAVPLEQLIELIGQLEGDKITFEQADAMAPIRITPNDESVLALQMPARWDQASANDAH